MNRVSKAVQVATLVMLSLAGLARITNAEIKARVSGPSPFKPGCDRSGSTATNYENAEVEPWLAIDPHHPEHLVGIWQQDRWHNGGAHGLVTGISYDAGRTWKRTFAHFSRCAGGNSNNGGDYERAGDPWITFSPSREIYESVLAFDTSDLNEAILVSRSADGGMTWSNPTTLMFDADPTVIQDKDSITADPKKRDFVYAIWSRYVYTDASLSILLSSPAWFSRTTDGGASWEPARDIYDAPTGFYAFGHEIVVLPNGTLVNIFGQYDGNNPSTALALFTIRSSDHGLTWSPPTLIDVSDDIGITDVKTGELVRGGVANIAVDPHSGTLYMVWQDDRFSGGLRDGIAFSKSTDGGLSWSTKVQVNQAPNVQAFAPSIAVNKHGRIAIAYYDFRKDTPDPNVLLTNYWRITSDDSGTTWHEIPLSPSFDLRTAPVTGLGYMIGDYEGLVPSEDSFTSLFVRTNSGNTSNRTDVFAVSTEAEGDTRTNDHVEINLHPFTMMEQMLLRKRRAP